MESSSHAERKPSHLSEDFEFISIKQEQEPLPETFNDIGIEAEVRVRVFVSLRCFHPFLKRVF
jgi:hypothetical protein